jgi:ribosome-binding factor A
MLRTEVGKNITARLTPSLEFIADGVPENAALIDSLLAEAHNRDTEVAALATSATYAGDEDPYVKPRLIVDDDDEPDVDDDDDDEPDDDVEDDLYEDGEAEDLDEGAEDTLT